MDGGPATVPVTSTWYTKNEFDKPNTPLHLFIPQCARDHHSAMLITAVVLAVVDYCTWLICG